MTARDHGTRAAGRPPSPTADGQRDLRGLGPRVGPSIAEADPATATRARDAVFRRALVAADAGAGAGTVLVAAVLLETDAGTDALAFAAVLLAFLIVLCSKLSGLYDRDELLIDKSVTLDEIPQLFGVATLIALLTSVSSAGAAADRALQGASLLVLWLGLLVTLIGFRTVARAFALRHTTTERCLIVGDADSFFQLAERLRRSAHINSTVVGYVAIRDHVRTEDPSPLGALADLDALLLRHDVHRVIIAPRDVDSDAPVDVVRRVKALGVRVSVLPRILEVVGSSIEFDDVDGMTVLGVRRFGLPRSSRIVKRGFDLGGALLVMALASPLLALIALVVRRNTPGPVLFRQQRVGRDGELFEILKFRTMVVGAEAGKDALREVGTASNGLFKLEKDPRVTRSGRWLRETSLDELPQLVNVVRGEMSLVGPRPLVLDEDCHVEGWNRRRLHLKPGMTGPWQILTSGRIPLYEMVKLDYLYIVNWSLWNDTKLILRTVPYVLRRRGL